MALHLTVQDARLLLERRVGLAEDERTGCWYVGAGGKPGPYSVFYAAAFGTVPQGMRVAHRCSGRERGCVRPAHLDLIAVGEDVVAPEPPPLAAAHVQSFRQRITDELEARGSARDLARELAISVSTLRSWAAGESAPSEDTALEVAQRLGWDGARRRWVVTAVVQRVVEASSAGGAAAEVRKALVLDGQVPKLAVHDVRPIR